MCSSHCPTVAQELFRGTKPQKHPISERKMMEYDRVDYSACGLDLYYIRVDMQMLLESDLVPDPVPSNRLCIMVLIQM